MIKTLKSSFQLYKGLQEWFDPATEPHFAQRSFVRGKGVKITIDGIAKKTVWIIR